jgi:hypothetical protein
LAVAVGCAAVVFCAGCENDQQRADKAAKAKIEAADRARAIATSLQQLADVQQRYDSLGASISGLSPQLRILIHGDQGGVRLQRAVMMLAQLRAKELEIQRDINQIEQLSVQIAAAQASVEALQAYDPTGQIEAVRAREAAIQGAAAPAGGADQAKSMASIAQLAAEIDRLNSEIVKNKADAQALKKSRDQAIEKAEGLVRKSEAEQGDQQVRDTIRASQLRRDAGIADAQLETLASRLARMQSDLDTAGAQKSALQLSVAALEAQMQSLQSGWASMQQQMDAQRKLQQQIILGTDAPDGSVSIAQQAGELTQAMADANTLRDGIASELDSAISQFDSASGEAARLRTELMTQVTQNATAAAAPIWRQTMETLHPMVYGLQKASALQARASMAAGKMSLDVQIAQMFDGFEFAAAQAAAGGAGGKPVKVPGLTALLAREKTGVEMPPALANLHRSDAAALQQMKQDVDAKFQEAIEAYDKRYGAVDSGPEARERMNVTMLGRAVTNRKWAEFDASAGDTAGASQHGRDADADQVQVDPAFLGAGAALLKPAEAPAASPATGSSESGGGSPPAAPAPTPSDQ